MILLRLLFALAGMVTQEPGRTVLSTIFEPPQQRFSCLNHTAKRTAHAVWLYNQQLFVAASTAPRTCWDVLEICLPRTGKCVEATIADHLPQKAWRGKYDLDLWFVVARALEHEGMERVVVRKLSGEKRGDVPMS